MQLSRASRHVLQALVHLARERPGVWVTAQEIGRAEGLLDKFLRMLLGRLVKARLVRSVKGANGGYSLACAPKDITLLEIIETVDGPVRGDAPSVSDADATALDTRLQDVSDGAAAAWCREWLAEVDPRRVGEGEVIRRAASAPPAGGITVAEWLNATADQLNTGRVAGWHGDGNEGGAPAGRRGVRCGADLRTDLRPAEAGRLTGCGTVGMKADASTSPGSPNLGTTHQCAAAGGTLAHAERAMRRQAQGSGSGTPRSRQTRKG